MFQPDELIIDSIVPSFEGCKGTESGSIEIWVTGGKRFNPNSSSSYDGDEYYSYSLSDSLGNIVAYSDTLQNSSSNFSTIGPPIGSPNAREHVKFSNLPIIKNDTNDIIEYTKEIENFKNKKQRKYWDLLKTNEK